MSSIPPLFRIVSGLGALTFFGSAITIATYAFAQSDLISTISLLTLTTGFSIGGAFFVYMCLIGCRDSAKKTTNPKAIASARADLEAEKIKV